jgi:hypothetical protein
VFGHAAGQHDVGERLDDTETIDAAGDADRQAFTAVFVDQRQQSELAAVMRLRLDEIITPHMIAVLRPQPDAGPIIEPQPASGPLFLRDFQPLTAPDAAHPVGADRPSPSLSIRVIRR